MNDESPISVCGTVREMDSVMEKNEQKRKTCFSCRSTNGIDNSDKWLNYPVL